MLSSQVLALDVERVFRIVAVRGPVAVVFEPLVVEHGGDRQDQQDQKTISMASPGNGYCINPEATAATAQKPAI